MKRLVAGPRAVREALDDEGRRVAMVFIDRDRRRAMREIEDRARTLGIRVELEESSALETLAQGIKHQGVIALSSDFPYLGLEDLLAQSASTPLLVALDQITDPHNFGAIIRSAVALGADGVVTLKDRAAPVTPAVVRASAGATERARIARVTNLARTLEDLSARGLQVVGLDASAPTLLESLPFPETGRVIVIGSEGQGLRRLVRERCEVLAQLPLEGPIASLNASVAAGIAIYIASRQRARRSATQPSTESS